MSPKTEPDKIKCFSTPVPVRKPRICSNGDRIPRCGKPEKEMDCGYGIGTWGWLVAFILVLFALTVFLWILLYSLNPSWVQSNGVIDTAKVLLWALIIAFIIDLVLAIIKFLYTRYCCHA